VGGAGAGGAGAGGGVGAGGMAVREAASSPARTASTRADDPTSCAAACIRRRSVRRDSRRSISASTRTPSNRTRAFASSSTRFTSSAYCWNRIVVAWRDHPSVIRRTASNFGTLTGTPLSRNSPVGMDVTPRRSRSSTWTMANARVARLNRSMSVMLSISSTLPSPRAYRWTATSCSGVSDRIHTRTPSTSTWISPFPISPRRANAASRALMSNMSCPPVWFPPGTVP